MAFVTHFPRHFRQALSALGLLVLTGGGGALASEPAKASCEGPVLLASARRKLPDMARPLNAAEQATTLDPRPQPRRKKPVAGRNPTSGRPVR
jgi:hypothetical protein